MVNWFIRISPGHVETIEPHKERVRRTLRCVSMMAAAVVAAPINASLAAAGSGYSNYQQRADYRRRRSCMCVDI